MVDITKRREHKEAENLMTLGNVNFLQPIDRLLLTCPLV